MSGMHGAALGMRALAELALKRDLATVSWPEEYDGLVELGGGRNPIGGPWANLDLPGWDARRDAIPYGDGEVNAVWAFHFFEHLAEPDVLRVLREVERVLRPGGQLFFGVPLAGTELSFDTIDHRTFWTPSSMRHILANAGYRYTDEWALCERSHFVFGVEARNLMVFFDVEKRAAE